MSNHLSTPRKRSGGRKHKGPRHPSMVRFPVELYAELKAEADEAGYENFGDYIIDLCRARRQVQPTREQSA